jgi:hypothetical protein
VLDLPSDAGVEESKTRLAELHARYREDYRAYYGSAKKDRLRCAAQIRPSC